MSNKSSRLHTQDFFLELEQKFKAAGYGELLPLLPELPLIEVKALLENKLDTKFYHAREKEETAAIAKLSQLQKRILLEMRKRLMEGKVRVSPGLFLRLIDGSSFNAEAATCSRTLKRLEERGLITRYPPERTEYVCLTGLGFRAAKRLSISLALVQYNIKNG